MPSTSKKQHKFMEAVAHSPSFAKKVGVPQSVGQDFSNADKSRKFSKGGNMAGKMNPGFMAMIAKKKAGAKGAMPMKEGGAAKKMMGGGMAYAKGGGVKASSMGAVRTAAPSRDGVAMKGKTKGKQIKM
jgi:hypothetical protein